MQDIKEKKTNLNQYLNLKFNAFFRHCFSEQRLSCLFVSGRFLLITSFFFISFSLLFAALHLPSINVFAQESAISKTDSGIEKKGFDDQINRSNLKEEDKYSNRRFGEKENPISTNSNPASLTNNQKTQDSTNNTQVVSTTNQSEFGWKKYFQAVGTMLFLLLLLWYVLKVVKKYGTGRFLPAQKLLPKDAMYLEGQLSLGPNKCITVVKILDRRLVLGITEKNITLLTEMVDNEEFEYTKSFQEHIQDTETSNSSSHSHSSRPSTP